MKERIEITVLGNSHAFLREAAEKASVAADDARQWQFAIIHVAGALELTLKALLSQVHPAFMYESIDSQNRTVGPHLALGRLRDGLIGNLSITEAESQKVLRVIQLRNQFVHSSFELRAEYASAKFFEAFAFVVDFQARYLGSEVDEIVSPDVLGRLLRAERGARELAERASRRIVDEGLPDDGVWVCPDCGNDTFVVFEGADVCYTCRFSGLVEVCPHCGEARFDHELSDFSRELDWVEESGGRQRLHNDFGYKSWKACEVCLPRILDDIRQQRLDEEYYDRMRDHYYERYGHDPTP